LAPALFDPERLLAKEEVGGRIHPVIGEAERRPLRCGRRQPSLDERIEAP